MLIPEALRSEWGDYVWWDAAANAPKPLTRDQVGAALAASAIRCSKGAVEVTLADGKKVALPPGLRPGAGVRGALRSEDGRGDHLGAGGRRRGAGARASPSSPGTTLFAVGMGPNQFFNNDNKDRDIFLLAALTGNVGKLGGNVGSYAGNYRVALFNGAPQYINENPFDLELDPAKPARPKQYWKAESAHYYNHEDHPLQGRQQAAHRQDPHADADQVALVRQRQLDPRQRQVALQHGGQRAAEDRDDRGQRMVVVDLVRVGRRRLRRRLAGPS